MEIRQGRLDVTEMEQMFDELQPELVIDATHPYAAEVTHNIKMACSKRKGLRLLRCLREPGAGTAGRESSICLMWRRQSHGCPL